GLGIRGDPYEDPEFSTPPLPSLFLYICRMLWCLPALEDFLHYFLSSLRQAKPYRAFSVIALSTVWHF
ncbi:hypothetical protein U1Q18_006435, partial [Sarracenia purpurea var. burkii]